MESHASTSALRPHCGLPEAVSSVLPEPTRRSLGIDFVRGLALLIMFSDHVHDNPLSTYTPIGLGFSDMSELFLFLSGYVNGLKVRTSLDLTRFGELIAKSIRQCVRVYIAIVVMGVLTAMLNLATDTFCGIRTESTDGVWSSTWVWQIITLQYVNGCYCVLALYLPLIAATPLILICLKWNPVATIVLSFILYLSVQAYPTICALPEPWNSFWYFNPFAWQFLFVAGLAFGSVRESWTRWVLPGPLTVIAALAIAALALAIKITEGTVLNDYRFMAAKDSQGILRLVHFCCVLVVGHKLLINSAIVKIRCTRPVIACGQHPLPTFCVGGIAATCGTMFLVKYSFGIANVLLVNILGWATLVLTAYVARGLVKKGRLVEKVSY